MCGIVGYNGCGIAQDFVLKSLKKLDYRGYDSAGVCYIENAELKTVKAVGKIENLKQKLKKQVVDSSTMIGHTRWATHGNVSEKNAHPQLSNDGKVAVVHNGIVENYDALKIELQNKGTNFFSQTDTEVIPNLLQQYLKGKQISKFTILNALKQTTNRLVGTYALCVVVSGCDNVFVCSRFSPLVVCKLKNATMVSSDKNALPQGEVFKLKDNYFAILDKKEILFFDENLNQAILPKLDCKSESFDGSLKGFSSFMEKEISQNGFALENTIKELEQNSVFNYIDFLNPKHIIITACGTALHAGRVLKYLLKEICDVDCYVDYASEFRYFPPTLNKDCLCVFISQSGETADTLSCVQLAKQFGAKTLGITNQKNSTLASVVDILVCTNAGTEYAVASTKAFVAQLAVDYDLAYHIAQNKRVSCNFSIPMLVNQAKLLDSLETKELDFIAEKVFKSQSLYVLGRGLDYVLAQEGALKIKEVSYIHCEALPLGELKHGSLALFNKETYCFVVMTNKNLYLKVKNNINEIKSRGAKVILITNSNEELDVDYTIKLETEDIFSPFYVAKVFQTLALKISTKKHIDVDKPRNLAKSVTVE